MKKLGYEPATSFEPVCYLAATPMLLVVNGASPYRALADFIAAARARPANCRWRARRPKVLYEVIKRSAGVQLTYVPLAGTAPAINGSSAAM